MDIVRFALLSVAEKEGIVEFAKVLLALGYILLSTGGTARTLREAGLEVTEVSEYTGFPEGLEGRVKTLVPQVHGGILFRRDVEEHVSFLNEHGIHPIDVVVCNLYKFEEAAVQPGVTREELVEKVDIGGPSMVRSAAKNHDFVAVVVDPADYGWIIPLLEAGNLNDLGRRNLARKAFRHTAAYDAAIAENATLWEGCSA